PGLSIPMCAVNELGRQPASQEQVAPAVKITALTRIEDSTQHTAALILKAAGSVIEAVNHTMEGVGIRDAQGLDIETVQMEHAGDHAHGCPSSPGTDRP